MPRDCRTRVASKSSNELWIWIGIVILILIIIGIACACNSSGENFMSGIMDKFRSGNSELKGMDVLFFMSPSCPWCTKMKKVMEDEGTINDVTVIDVTKPEGQEEAKKYGAIGKGIPSFISRKLKTGTVGFKPKTKDIVDALNKAKDSVAPTSQPDAPPTMNPQEAVSAVQQLQLVLFASPTCGWCTKMKEALTQAGVGNYVEVVDISQPEGKAQLQQMVPEFRGVPVVASKTTGKTSVGFKPLDKIIEEVQ